MQIAYAGETPIMNEPSMSLIIAVVFAILVLFVLVYIVAYWIKIRSRLRWVFIFLGGFTVIGIIAGFLNSYKTFGSYQDAFKETGFLCLGMSIAFITWHYLAYVLRRIYIFIRNRFVSGKNKIEKEIVAKQKKREMRLLLDVGGEQRDITDLTYEQQVELLQSLRDDSYQSDQKVDPSNESQQGAVSVELIHYIVLSIIALSVTSLLAFRIISHQKPEPELWGAMTFILGYFFGTQTSKRSLDQKPLEEKKVLSKEDFDQILQEIKRIKA